MMQGQWVLSGPPRTASKKKQPYWHWVHKQEGTTYCGIRRPTNTLDEQTHWNPLLRACRKCLDRIGREGY